MINRFDLHVNTATTGVIKAAEVALLEEQKRLTQVGFRYTPAYLELTQAFALDPAQLPLQPGEFNLVCAGAAPAILDDYLPDAWGRKILTKMALRRQQHIDAHCVSDMLDCQLQTQSHIGAVAVTALGEMPVYADGVALADLQQAESCAQSLDQAEVSDLDPNAMGLVYLANSGTGVGGARPKALVHDEQGRYLAKFNRQNDSYNNARVELACLNMARAAGVQIGKGRVVNGVNARDVLLLDRFDVQGTARAHVITVNGLLKQPNGQQDPGQSFRYDDIHALLQNYSCAIEQDLQQLLARMLFNRAIHNTDDHERNFSLMHTADGYQLAPAYDLVPSLTLGEYHAAGFGYQPNPPTPRDAERLGRVFGLTRAEVHANAERVIAAVDRWSDFAEDAGVEEAQMRRIAAVLQ